MLGGGDSIVSVLIRALRFGASECAEAIEPPTTLPATGWVWIDITAASDEVEDVIVLTEALGLNALAVRDAVQDTDLPKVDDFGGSLFVVLHALSGERIDCYQLSCFLSQRCLVTIHRVQSPSVDVLWDGVMCQPEVASGGTAQEHLAGSGCAQPCHPGKAPIVGGVHGHHEHVAVMACLFSPVAALHSRAAPTTRPRGGPSM